MNKTGYVTKLIAALLLAAVALMCFPSDAAAVASYQYNASNEAMAAPEGYEPIATVRSNDIKESLSWVPTDLCIDTVGEVHLLDQENGCIYVFDNALKYLRTVVFTEDGKDVFLANLNGVCVKRNGNDIIYFVADTENKRVFMADGNGNILRKITKPESVAFDSKTSFSPIKVGLDSNYNLYVLASGVYQGIAVFSAKDDYKFITFIGGNTVESTATVLADYFWKQIFNKTQIASMRRYVPVSAANFAIDDKNNVYTVTNKSSKGTNFENEIKEFNANNINIIKQQDWGDLELAPSENNLVIDTSYVDVAVGNNGILAGLDGNLCRVAVFTSQGDRLFTFGENNKINGTFDTPVAIAMRKDNIYVVDSSRQSITLFSPNDYGKLVLEATKLYIDGDYDKAFGLWQEIAAKNGGCLLAYVAMGKYYLSQKDYKQALNCFRQGSDRESYSQAFSLQRSKVLQKFFPIAAIFLLVGFIALLVADAKLKNKRIRQVDPANKKIVGRIFYALFHPCEGSIQLARKTESTKTMSVSLIILSVWFFASICKWCFSGFIFNTNIQSEFNIWLQLAKTFGLFLLWVSSMWLITNLMDSSARFTDIIIVSAVALIPYIISLFAYAAMSNVLCLEENTYLTVIQAVALIWFFAVLLGGLREVNEMSFSGTLLCMVFTVLGMALVIFLLILLWSLFQQFISFAAQILIEIKKMIV